MKTIINKLNSWGVVKKAVKEGQGYPGVIKNKCLGYSPMNDDEPIESCKRCKFNSSYED